MLQKCNIKVVTHIKLILFIFTFFDQLSFTLGMQKCACPHKLIILNFVEKLYTAMILDTYPQVLALFHLKSNLRLRESLQLYTLMNCTRIRQNHNFSQLATASHHFLFENQYQKTAFVKKLRQRHIACKLCLPFLFMK